MILNSLLNYLKSFSVKKESKEQFWENYSSIEDSVSDPIPTYKKVIPFHKKIKNKFKNLSQLL